MSTVAGVTPKEAQRALERAFALNQRQDWLAVRLARRYEDVSDWDASIRALDVMAGSGHRLDYA